MKTVSIDRQKTLVQWVSQATGINTFGVKVRLLGNDLHILCEGIECPKRWQTLSDLLQALQQTDLDSLTEGQPPIYQVFAYGRKKGEYRPQWCHRVHLNQLDRHLEQVEQQLLTDAEAKQPGGALIVSNESLARQGNPDAIARYLSENLSILGVSVKVQIKPYQSKTDAEPEGNRLWILCQSGYSPDAAVLSEPVAQRLRDLKLTGYKDAVIASQVRGENAPDWLLRVDLTPPETMLKEWARWGDIQAIARLLNEALAAIKVSIQASLKESTLHIFCAPAFDPLETAIAPDKAQCLRGIVPLLEAIAPQGILAATIYGQKTGKEHPDWVSWLSLPATEHPALATPALELAIDGDEPALIFLLERLLNPDLDWRLRTGGIRVLLVRRNEVLHILCDAPVCPSRHQVANKVTQFIRQLNIAGILGVRVYGRRSGDKEPVWNHGLNFTQRPRLVPEAAPEFAATADYVHDLVNNDTNEPILRPDLTSQDVQNYVTEVAQDWFKINRDRIKNLLLNSQLFTESHLSTEQNPEQQGIVSGLIWLALGLVLTLQSDWMLGYVISRTIANSSLVTAVANPNHPELPTTEAQNQTSTFVNSAENSKNNNSAFNASGFIQNDADQSGNLPAAPLKQKATATAILLAARSPLPSFNARQLDEQLALYKQRLATTGKPPDILIIGSSRALRGVDPVALSKGLASQGYPQPDVFNFGINGATAQVVEFIITQLLEPAELPKMIIWADGSRAFNSGREDATFKAIATSPGYQQVLQKLSNSSTDAQSSPSKANANPNPPAIEQPATTNNYQTANEWLNQAIARLSVSYKHRDQIKGLLQKQLKNIPGSNQPQITTNPKITTDLTTEELQQAVDFDGFLPLSIRFNPTRYYQEYPKVVGTYDNDYKDFQVAGSQEKSFLSVLEFAKTKQISVVFVNMPLTEDYLDPVRRKYEQEFQKYMQSNSNNPIFTYRDLSEIWLTENDYFSDPSHLNRYGAYEVSKKLANDPIIPWPTR
ncbi:MAG TPA: DUF1574 domain-containing protein [Nostocaceae cyanobacterium]|nr:DUF1574 domain-containing protein [Nostocaceae cyanobacterium]